MVRTVSAQSSLVNFRDAGGSRTEHGGSVAKGVLYRSEAPQGGDAAPAGVSPWPVPTVIDLRSAGEIRAPHPLRENSSLVHHLAIDPALAPDAMTRYKAAADLVPLYLHLLDVANGQIARIVRAVAEGDGPVLIHCAAGKDRTGIVVAILLRAVGVSRDHILADYLRSNDRLPALLGRLRRAGATLPSDSALLRVSPDALNAVLDRVDNAPGGVAGWLRASGTDTETVRLLHERLNGPRPAAS